MSDPGILHGALGQAWVKHGLPMGQIVIRIAASDNSEVKAVEVVIEDLTGRVIEKGPAGQENGAWVYRAQTQVPAGRTVVIHASATDHPGHAGSKRARPRL